MHNGGWQPYKRTLPGRPKSRALYNMLRGKPIPGIPNKAGIRQRTARNKSYQSPRKGH